MGVYQNFSERGMKCREITGEVWQVGGGGITAAEDAAVYLLRFGDEAALIDAGAGKGHAALISNIEECGVAASQIGYLFLTHCHYDHTGGAERLRVACGCRVVAHQLDAKYLESGDSCQVVR